MIPGKLAHGPLRPDINSTDFLLTPFLHRVNCRLPQTPRTPGAAASHYFDETFSRQRRASLGGRRPTGLARSATRTRSIGARSDFSAGAADDGDDDVEIDANGKPTRARSWSIYKEDGTANGKKPEDPPADDAINRYVQEQLERIKSHESAEFAEELAAQTDGAGDEL